MTAVYHSVAETAPSRYTAPPSTADVLHRAADLLEEFGWCQGDIGGKEFGAFCIGGAVAAAHEDLTGEFAYCHWRRRDAHLTHQLALPDLLALDDIPAWNDAPGRTKEQVVARLREAAEAAA